MNEPGSSKHNLNQKKNRLGNYDSDVNSVQTPHEENQDLLTDSEAKVQSSAMCEVKTEQDLSPNHPLNDLDDSSNTGVGAQDKNSSVERVISHHSNEDIVVTPKTTKGKPGRKKKSNTVLTNENCEEFISARENQSSIINEEVDESQPTPKGKRGRVKRVANEQNKDNTIKSAAKTGEDNPNITQEDENLKPGPPKGRRGRKRKAPLLDGEVPEHSALAANVVNEENAADDGSEEIHGPRRRKAAGFVSYMDDSGDDSLESSTPRIKRQSRKAASSVYYGDDESDSSELQVSRRGKTLKSNRRASSSTRNCDNSVEVGGRGRGKRKRNTVENSANSNVNDSSACDLIESENVNLTTEEGNDPNDSQTGLSIKVETDTANLKSVPTAKSNNRNIKAPADVIPVKCSSCLKDMPSNEFSKHSLDNHNNLAWIVGEDPIDFNDEKLINKLLKLALKKGRKKKLVCERCGAEKKSVLGFVGHRRFCGKTGEERENLLHTCELCGRKVMPVSIKAHMSIHERQSKPAEEGTATNFSEDSGRKRAAATKAKSKMTEFLHDDDQLGVNNISPKRLLYSSPKEMKRTPSKSILKWKAELEATNSAKCLNSACSFEADSLAVIRKHTQNCEFAAKAQGFYSCVLCVFKCENEAGIQEHVSTVHPWSNDKTQSGKESGSDVDIKLEDESQSDDMESDGEQKRANRFRAFQLKTKKSSFKYRFLAIEDSGKAGPLEAFAPAFTWALKFRLDNDSNALFNSFHRSETDWELLDPAEVERYLPATRRSVYTSFGDPQTDMSAMFVGGPIWSLAWCPLPLNVAVLTEIQVPQFLAVSCHRQMDEYHTAFPCYVAPNIIQIWDCGVLNNSESPTEPKLALAIAHEFGTVWRFEWCPSGAYACREPGTLLRMGLLAAACSDGCVHIFSVCFPNELHAHEQEKRAPVYRVDPVLTLRSNAADPSQCTRLSWYRGKGHGMIAGGFCDGKIALWNLENFSTLLYDKDNRELYPYHTFQAHLSVVSALSLSPEGHFLMSGSHDCFVKFWDLEDTTAPLTINRRGMVTDGVWLSHWIAGIAAYDDAFLHEHSNATVLPVREYGFKPFPAIPQNSVAWCLSESTWLNSIVQGTQAGEVALNIAGQLFTGLDNEKYVVKKRMDDQLCSYLERHGVDIAYNLVYSSGLPIFQLRMSLGPHKTYFCRYKTKMLSFTELRDLIKDDYGNEKLGPTINPPGVLKAPVKPKVETVVPPETPKSSTPEPPESTLSSTPASAPASPPESKETPKQPETSEAPEQGDDNENLNGVDVEIKTTVFDLNPQDYKDTSEKYGINIINLINYDADNIPPEATKPMRQSNHMHPVHSDMYPITSVNQVQWNPNVKSCLWMAIGHHSGLLRLACVRYMHTVTVDRLMKEAEAVVEEARTQDYYPP